MNKISYEKEDACRECRLNTFRTWGRMEMLLIKDIAHSISNGKGEEGIDMEFNYVVCRWLTKSNKEKVLGGFLDLEAAKTFVEYIFGDFFCDGFFYIKSPEGSYIYGCYTDMSNGLHLWYKPNEKAFIFDHEKDWIVELEQELRKSLCAGNQLNG